MSSEAPTGSVGDRSGEDSEQATGVERIADPEDYAKRRRLKQLHDARDRVREIKDEAFRLEKTERTVSERDRDQFVAEALADYIAELRVVLARRGGDEDSGDEEFLNETVMTRREALAEISIDDIRQQRGHVSIEERRVPISYETAMRAWDICNSYFEEIAGATFETEGMPKERGFQSVEKAEDEGEDGDD